MRRHDRPYKCNHPSCSAAQRAFGSINDWRRHTLNGHKGVAVGYAFVCTIGECADPTNTKVWPNTGAFCIHVLSAHSVVISFQDADNKHLKPV